MIYDDARLRRRSSGEYGEAVVGHRVAGGDVGHDLQGLLVHGEQVDVEHLGGQLAAALAVASEHERAVTARFCRALPGRQPARNGAGERYRADSLDCAAGPELALPVEVN